MGDYKAKQANDPLDVASQVRRVQANIGRDPRSFQRRKGPACTRCSDSGYIYLLPARGRARASDALTIRPCFDCLPGQRMHGLPGKACRVAGSSRRDCPYCGAGYDSSSQSGGPIPFDFAGESDLSDDILNRSIPLRDKIKLTHLEPGYRSPFAVSDRPEPSDDEEEEAARHELF